MYEYWRRTPSPLTIEYLSRSFGGGKASVSVKVKLEESVAEGHSVYVVLWEDNLSYSGRTFHFVERALANPETLTAKNANDEQIIKREFALGSGWNTANLGVSVFVQNPSSKAILQGRATKLAEGVAVTPTSLGRVKALYN
jgi:hypothetical protein